LIGNESIVNVSWSDLNNVQEGGDYSFRDGTITVTFAEVASWKNNPNAQFQLMRKHPIQGAPSYVLGKRVEEEASSDNSSLIYQSSNGDSWFLTRDPVTGAAAVMHTPNPQSSGQASYVEIEKFLSEGASGPEHEALRHAIEASARMSCACRKLNPGILVMQSAQGWATKNVPGAIDGARDRCIFLQG
jgi:hypothetical protein